MQRGSGYCSRSIPGPNAAGAAGAAAALAATLQVVPPEEEFVLGSAEGEEEGVKEEGGRIAKNITK